MTPAEDAGVSHATHAGYDLAIVGSGGAAFSAAIAATDLGMRVVMIERGTLGGTCVNVGCIPSKSLLAAAESRRRAADSRFPGISTSAGAVDVAALMAGKAEIVDGLRLNKYTNLAAEYGIELVKGSARFVEGPALEVGARRIEASHYLVATGAQPHIPEINGLTESGYLTSTTAMELASLPSSMIVLGGGFVAMEQAQLFADLGCQVTVLVRSALARSEEPEIAVAALKAMRADGIVVHERIQVQAVHRDAAGIVVQASGQMFRAEHLLVATGRRPYTDDLDLMTVGVATGERGEVLVGSNLQTTNPRVWGAGDAIGHPQFVYVAARHGALVVENAFENAGHQVDYQSLPRITFTTPAIASAGLTEAQAREQGLDVDSRVLGLEHVPRAIVSRDTRGLVKLVAERESGRVVGVHLLATGAGDAILAAVYAIDAKLTVAQLATSWNPYLTIGEAIHLTAQSFTRDPAKLSCCA